MGVERKRRLLRHFVSLGLMIGGLFAPSSHCFASSGDSVDLTLTVTVLPETPPSDIIDLTASSTPVEGDMRLDWTSPGDDGTIGDLVNGKFLIQYSTSQITSFADPADIVIATNAAALSAQSYAVHDLEPGATYYFAVVAEDDIGQRSVWSVGGASNTGNFGVATDLAPPAPAGLVVTQTGVSTFTATWSAAAAADLDYYKIYVDATVPYDFADAWVVTAPKTSTSALIGGLTAGTYVLHITAVDKGAPAGPGVALESAPSADVTGVITIRLAQAPYGVDMSVAAGTVTLRWLPVTRYADLGSFVDPLAPTDVELTSYHVYRSSALALGTWSDLAALSTATWSWTGVDVATEPYYAVRAGNNHSDLALSDRSMVRAAATLEGFVVAPDGQSFFRIPASALGPFVGVTGDPASAYAAMVSSRPQDLGGRVYQSLDLQAYRGGLTLDPDFSLGGMGTLRLHYDVSSSTLGPVFTGGEYGPDNASVYWWNGARWLQLYGKFDSLSRNLFLDTKYMGRYQLRSVERATSFAFNLAGLSNRFVTPNGDGKNDTVTFTFDNPLDTKVTGRIRDLHGRVVVGELQAGPVANTLQWDGTANGRGVPGGVYIYELEADGLKFTGTLVILK